MNILDGLHEMALAEHKINFIRFIDFQRSKLHGGPLISGLFMPGNSQQALR
jgi:hypothetical protein